MTAFNEIPAALTGAFVDAAFFPLSRIAFPNAGFTKPAPSVSWCSLFMLPSPVAPLSMNDSDDQVGVMQIDLNYPENTGAGAVQSMADQIGALFKIGAVFDGVKVTSTSIAQGLPVDGWYRVPVSVQYRAITSR